jgi:hypothetical protein
MRMKPLYAKTLLCGAFVLVSLLAPREKALSINCSIAHTFITGETLTAANMNANPIAQLNCTSNLDHNNVGAAGFYASQIIPTTTGQATFGGTQPYAFPNALTVKGTLTAGAAGKATITDDGTNAYLQSPNAVFLQANGGTQTLSLSPSGLFSLPGALTVPGVLSGTSATFSGALSTQGNMTVSSGNAYIGGGGASQFAMTSNTAAAQTNAFTMNATNNDTNIVQFLSASSPKSQVLQNGTYSTGSSTYGPTSASVNGALTLAGALSGVTTGSFSGAITGASYSGGAITGTTGVFSGAVQSQSSYLPPFFGATGAVALSGSGAHITVVQPGAVVANGNCANNSLCAGTPQTTSLTGGGAFSVGVLGCWAGANTAPWALTWNANSVTYQYYNSSGLAVTSGSGLGTPDIFCVGY